MSHVVLVCKLCDGTGRKLKNGEQCMCYLFGGPIKRFDDNLWKIGQEKIRYE